MKQLMESILSIDHIQDERFHEMQRKQAQEFVRIQTQAKYVSTEFRAQAVTRLEKVDQHEDAQAKEQIKRLQSSFIDAERELAQRFALHSEQWRQNLLERVVGLEKVDQNTSAPLGVKPTIEE